MANAVKRHPQQPSDATFTEGDYVFRMQEVSATGAGSGGTAATSVFTGHDTTGIADNRKTVTTAGTAVQLITASTLAKWVIVTALTNNTQQVNVGASTVLAASGTSRGVPLLPGDSATLLIDNVNEVYVDSRVNGEGVSLVYGT